MEWLGNEYRNTVRSLAPEMGVAWLKVSKGVYALARPSSDASLPALRQRLVDEVRRICVKAGGSVRATWLLRELPQDLWVSATATLKLRNIKSLPEVCRRECEAAELRLSNGRFKVGDVDDYQDALHVHFDATHLAAAVGTLSALQLPRRRQVSRQIAGVDFLQQPCCFMGPQELQMEQQRPGYVEMQPLRQHLPAYQMADEICQAVRDHQVTLILGATGCGKTTQIPQFLLEDCASRGEICRLAATQPRRISAVSVADRVAVERGGQLGDTVGFKIRFEDKVTESCQVVFCTVGILLKVMQSNPTLKGATHIVVDEVHERGLHTDFLLTLLRRLLHDRPDLRLILMSATVDPSAFQEYFEGIHTVSIPGKTNYPIQEMFLEDFLHALPDLNAWRSSGSGRSSPFSQGPLPGVPLNPRSVAEALPQLSQAHVQDVVRVHNEKADSIDFELVLQVVEMIHREGVEGGIMIFMPGWSEISNVLERLGKVNFAHQLQVHALHSRLPSSEQKQIFQRPPLGKRKVVVATVLAETSITVEDVVFVVDAGRSCTTFFNEQTMISALRTVWYSKANGFQRRGRAGRCRPGVWYRLYTKLQWEAMDEYELPEMQRSPLEELCLEVASLQLGAPEDFLQEAISPPGADVLRHAVTMLERLGAVSDNTGAEVTPLGAKLAKLQVHPMLGKMLLLAAPFRCFEMMLTICASLGYKSPFVCPLGKEKEANKARVELSQGSKSDLVALVNAYEGWKVERASFAWRYYLSKETMEYIHRLREDLRTSVREVLHNVPEDHVDPVARAEAVKAVLTAGLFPNLAWLHRYGKGRTIQNLPVKAHPGSVNSKEGHSLVVFYEIQETMDRYLYDSTVIGAAPCLLFAPSLKEIQRKQRAIFELETWHVAVDLRVADELLALRPLVADFVNAVVGERLGDVQLEAAEVLQKLFAEQVETTGGDEEDEAEAENDGPDDAWDSEPRAKHQKTASRG